MSSIGADFSIDSTTWGSPLKEAINASHGPSVGFVAQMMTQGNKPRTIKTANTIPQRRNHRLARAETVPRTWALITALSIELTTSKRTSQMMMKSADICRDYREKVSEWIGKICLFYKTTIITFYDTYKLFLLLLYTFELRRLICRINYTFQPFVPRRVFIFLIFYLWQAQIESMLTVEWK